jgi:hypothetical protein
MFLKTPKLASPPKKNTIKIREKENVDPFPSKTPFEREHQKRKSFTSCPNLN